MVAHAARKVHSGFVCVGETDSHQHTIQGEASPAGDGLDVEFREGGGDDGLHLATEKATPLRLAGTLLLQQCSQRGFELQTGDVVSCTTPEHLVPACC